MSPGRSASFKVALPSAASLGAHDPAALAGVSGHQPPALQPCLLLQPL